MAPLPCSRTTRATSTSSPSRRVVSLMSMGRFTPVTISTLGDRKGRLTLVGVPPNMSVRMRTSPPPTSATARAMASRALFMSSVQPMETAAMAGMSPTMVRVALTSSPARAPWVTTTMPIIPSLLAQVAMAHADGVPVAGQLLRHRVRDHHRAVAAARAPDADGEVALPFPDVARNHVGEEVVQLLDEARGVRLALHVADDGRMVPGEGLEGRYEVRVGQEAGVEHEVRFRGHAVFVAERRDGEDQGRLVLAHVVVLADVVAELVHGVVRGIEDEVGHLADGAQGLALLADALDRGLVDGQGVGPPRLAEPALQDLLLRLQEEDAGREPLGPELPEHVRELLQEVALAHVHDEGGAVQLR